MYNYNFINIDKKDHSVPHYLMQGWYQLNSLRKNKNIKKKQEKVYLHLNIDTSLGIEYKK